MKVFCFFFFAVTLSYLTAQDCSYRSPVDGPTILSGSYGEPRTRHFHAGIDFKQRRGIPKDTIRAVEDGYISRINVLPDGYGNALYIDHPCGKTSVYAHLHHFSPVIAEYAKDVHYRLKKYAIVHRPEAYKVPIKKGDFIGIMGSTGRSSGPHLHFEIRDTESEASINPALFGWKPEDNIPPVIRGIIIYTLSPDGQELSKQYFPAQLTSSGYVISNNVISVDGVTVGIGIHTYDTMNGANNHNGIYSLNMSVDGEGQFRFKLDSLSFETDQYIHSHMDYEAKVAKRYVTKCFQNPGNPLPIYETRGEAGYISIYNFRAREISITVGDVEGNTAQVAFQVVRNGLTVPNLQEKRKKRIRPMDSLYLFQDNSGIEILKGTVAAPELISFEIVDSMGVYDMSQDQEVAIFKNIKLIRVQNPRLPKEKYCFLSTDDKGKVKRYPAKWENDSTMVTFVGALDKYEVGIDTIAPTIEVIRVPGKGRECKFRLADNYEPVYSQDAWKYTVYLDGKWHLCQHDAKTNTIWFSMDGPRQNAKHQIVVDIEDGSGNKNRLERSFVY